MVVVDEATLVNDDLGPPARKLARIQLDLVGEEDDPRMRHGNEPAKTFVVVVVLGTGSRGTRAVPRDHVR